MAEYLAPGVFVEETSYRQKTIEGVGTSTAAFIGPTRFGPVDGVPELLTSFGDYQRIYAGLDRLDDGGERPTKDNYVAHGVRAFFENGGRRCYVVRIADDAAAEGATAIPAEASDSQPRLQLEARHPGRAGNFQVTLRLRMGPNIRTEREDGSGKLRGAREHQVVWLDQVDVGGTVTQGALATLHDAFDEDINDWTYDLRSGAAPADDSFGLVSKLTAATKDVRVLTVDVEVGPLGQFLDPQPWPDLGLDPADRNSIHQVFAPTERASRRTELYVPLVVETPGLGDGPAVAAMLLEQSGAAAGLTGSGYIVSVEGARGGTLTLAVGGGTPREVAHDAEPAAVASALGGGATVSGRPGRWVVALSTETTLEADGTNLVGQGRVDIRPGSRWTLEPTDSFRLSARGRTTPTLPSDATADRVDDALEAIFGVGEVRVDKNAAVLTITVFGVGDDALTSTDPSLTAGDPVVVVDVVGDAGTFVLERPGGDQVGGIAPDAGAVAAALRDLYGLADPPAPVAGMEFLLELSAPMQGPLVADAADLTASGTATVTVAPVTRSLTTPGVTATVTARLSGGGDGPWPRGDAYGGSDLSPRKSGFHAMSDVPDVSIVAAPGSTHDYRNASTTVQDRVNRIIAHCEQMRYRIAVIDAPPKLLPTEVATFRGLFDSTRAAFYYPWITVFDPVTRGELDVAPSGHVAGIYARNDILRGVHKAPANETIALAVGFELAVNTAQQELLNPLGVNCLRHLDQRGRRVWGARTMTSDPEWKYVNVRRYFAYLEASIDRGTQWAVFEPNGHLLWDNVRRTIEDFLLNEFSNARLLGATPEEAFFVRCDRSTMTQNDLDNGRLVCLVGVSPLRPAEFVIFRIGQKTLEAAA